MAAYSGISFTNGGSSQAGMPIDFAATGMQLLGVADHLALMPANGTTVNNFGALSFTGVNSGINYYNVSGAALAAANGITITAPAGSTNVINVDGATDQIINMAVTLVGVAGNNVLFNFPQATSLRISGVQIPGSVLAPRAAVTYESAHLDGSLIAGSLQADPGQPLGQTNLPAFTTCTTP